MRITRQDGWYELRVVKGKEYLFRHRNDGWEGYYFRTKRGKWMWDGKPAIQTAQVILESVWEQLRTATQQPPI